MTPRRPRHVLVPALFVALALVGWRSPQATDAPVRLGSGAHEYTWIDGWAQLPDGMALGNTHGAVAFDSKGRVYVNTDTENAVMVFEPDGTFVRAWGEELAGGLHAMVVVERDGRELLYLAHTGRHEIIAATLDGEVLRTWGWPKESGHYESADSFRPTGVAVDARGHVFAVDGYGANWVHEWDGEGKWLRSFGGPGDADGRFRTCHGIFLDTGGEAPELVIADRENGRLQVFDLEGKHLRTIEGDFRRPCSVGSNGEEYVVADLAGRVTVIGRDGERALQLGDQPDPALRANNGAPRERWKDGEFIAPHHAAWDAAGNLFVMDWVAPGRVTKLERVRRR